MLLPPLGLPANLRIYLAVEPVDMRKQYDVLSRLPAMTNQDDLDTLTPRLWQPVPSSAS